VTLANGKKLSAITTDTIPVAKSTGSKPAPHWPGGHVRLGVVPGEKGYWANASSPSLVETTAKIKFDSEGLLVNIADAGKVAPFQPWAKDLYEYRQLAVLFPPRMTGFPYTSVISTGHWEGDTLIVTSTGYNERFWFSNGGLPHSENLKLTERISRPDFDKLKYEVTVDDPATYTRPWISGWTLQLIPNQEMEEYFCDDNNKDMERQAAK
jgi:hypothetical protein